MKTGSFASDDSFSVAADRSFPFTTTTQIIPHPSPPHDNYNSDYNNYNDTDGVSLTWEDLWVTASVGGKAKHILHGVTGYARPGEVLAIMGPSGSGKSTLLDALAGVCEYVTQDDILMTTLTVREAVYYSAHLQLPDTMTSAAKRFRAETTIKEMGLQDAVNTRISGWAVNGLSGGQKRRVSICMEILTRPKLLFLDEPTSGLDSAASYHVMSRIVGLAKHDGRTVVASIHQPSSEVFELFHNLCLLALLSYGNCLFWSEFFTCNGFPCPSLTNPSDHYLRTVNKDFEDKDIEQGPGAKSISVEESINILVNSYQSSDTFQEVKHKVAEMCKNSRGSMLMFIAAFLTFMAIGGFPSFVEDMKIFQRERLNGHYGLTSFVIGNTLSSTPYLALISIVPGAMAYYLVGLQKSFDHFVYFALVLFTCMMLVESLMMIFASVVPDFLMGIITGAGIQGVMMLNGGFFRLPHDLPKPVWRYPMFYVAFHRYANQGFYKNEFIGLTFPNSDGNGTITGEEVLRDVWQVNLSYSKWVDLAVLLGMVVLYRFLFLFIVKIKENLKSSVGACLMVQSQQAQLIMEQP
ncbi:ABC transporter G family member 11 [Acorus calamus]|uniref:ABC transporter G family member 11 n=1 Tax=Acorus calamus TaxID=4465 RepID=A0AAV9EVD3_ACOCL|nr:ABC transporter G family member 11 [Acorus calamus]